MTILAISGGGIRGIASAGVVAGLLDSEQLLWQDVTQVTGDSFGALLAALLGLGWSSKAIKDLLILAPLKKLLSPLLPWGARKALLPVRPLSLVPLEKWLANQFKKEGASHNRRRVLINYWDSLRDTEVFFTANNGLPDEARPVEQWARAVVRSMALPGLRADESRYLDGGIASHPPLPFNVGSERVVHVTLGFAGLIERNGDTEPKGLLEVSRALYAYEVTASRAQKAALARVERLQEWNPKVYDIDSLDLCLSPKKRLELWHRGYACGLNEVVGAS